MHKKIIHFFIICLVFIGMLFNSISPAQWVYAASKTSIAKINKTIKKGKTYKISKKIYKLSVKKIKFSSSNKKVATVSKKGIVKAKKVGKAIITVENKETKKGIAVYMVNVKAEPNKKDDNAEPPDSTVPPSDNTVPVSDDSSVATHIGEYYIVKSPSGISFDQIYTHKCSYNKNGFLEDWYVIYSKNNVPEAMYEVLVCDTNKKAVELQKIYGGTVEGNCIILFSDKEAANSAIKKFGQSSTTGFLEVLKELGYTSVG